MNIKFEIKNANRMAQALLNAGPKVKQQVNNVAKNNAEKGMAIAKRYAPKDTRFLTNNIITSYDGGDAVIHSRAGYSGYQEWGTRYQTGTPFMRPMLKDIRPQYMKDLENVAKGAFK